MSNQADRKAVARARKNVTEYINTLGSYIRNARSDTKRSKAQKLQRELVDIRNGNNALGADTVTTSMLDKAMTRYARVKNEAAKINWYTP
jgi:hypothetical protein